MKLHFHKFETINILTEQPAKVFGVNAICDYELRRCKCGKEKQFLLNLYIPKPNHIQINHTIFNPQKTICDD